MIDIFRKQYVELHEKRKQLVQDIKEQAEKLYYLLEYVNDREMSLAKTHLEQSIMWATKSITNKPNKTIGEPE